MLDKTLQSDDITPVQAMPMQVTWERSFFAALRALRHLYFRLEHATLELHSNCELCDEIRNFLALPNYRGDNIQNDDGWQPSFVVARDALTHLFAKLDDDGMKLHSATCHGCIEIRAFLSTPEYRGNFDDPLQVDMHRPLNYAPLGWVDETYENSLASS
jgi:hypothetical protein